MSSKCIAKEKSELLGGGILALHELMRGQETVKEPLNRMDYWLWQGVIGKVMSKVLTEKVIAETWGLCSKQKINMLRSMHLMHQHSLNWIAFTNSLTWVMNLLPRYAYLDPHIVGACLGREVGGMWGEYQSFLFIFLLIFWARDCNQWACHKHPLLMEYH